ncbi:MAG: CBS domain-containing protein [Proteobacteria bacterium]|nr:CBS domain-containing protein [Pseudomonadota bacterium]
MERYLVKDLMVPISEYATVTVGTTLLDALRVLERAQDAYTVSKYHHRAILVLDADGNVVGKISQLRALKAIQPEVELTEELAEIRRFKFSENYLAELRDIRSYGKIIKKETLLVAAGKKVEEFMQAPTPGEFVSEDSSLDIAIHRLVAGAHMSLLVTRDDRIVGVLRISDVFAALFHGMMAAAA